MRLELFTAPHCPYCASAHERLAEALAGRPVELTRQDILRQIDRAVDLGIRRTPALVLDGRLIHQGPLSRRRLQQLASDLPCQG